MATIGEESGPPDRNAKGQASHFYHAESGLLSGHLKHPVELKIEKQGFVSLKDDRGGHLWRRLELYSADDLISFHSGYTRVSGSLSQKHGWVTLATAVLEHLNVLDVITADRVVAQVSTELSASDGHVPSVTFLGTRFENLRICGCPVNLELDLGIFGAKPEHGQRYLEDRGFLDRVQRQLESIVGSKGLPENLEGQYLYRVSYLDDLRKRAERPAKGERDGDSELQCSLVKSIGPIPIRGAETFGNIIVVPDFGTLSLAEIEVGQSWSEEFGITTSFVLTMFNMQMGSIAEGTVEVANVRLNGAVRPPGGETSAEVKLPGTSNEPFPRPLWLNIPHSEQSVSIEHDFPKPSPVQVPTEEQDYQSRQLFPEISCEPSHVVQREQFTAIVRVLLEKPTAQQTTGDFWLPPGPANQVHIVDVHLLIRGESKRGEMHCSAAAGTIKEAVFQLVAPAMDTDERGSWKASMFEQIRVNFYLHGRWCGEAQTNIEILRDQHVKHCDRFPSVEEPLWRQHMHIEPGAEPPDLLVRIQKEGGDSFRWTLMSPHLNFEASDRDCVQTLEKPERYVQDNFEWLAGKAPDGINRVNVKGSCERLYRATPKAFQDAYWQLFRAAKAQREDTAGTAEKPIKFKTIQFVSDEPCVPWEIMQVVDRDREPDVGPVILSEKYQVGRWLSLSSCILRSKIEVHKFVVSTSTYSGIQGVTPLPWTQGEKDYLSAEPWKAEPLKLLLADVQEFLLKGSAQAIHFACHGAMDQAQPQRSKILLEDDLENFRTTAVDQDEVRMGIGKHHPLVFLNACQLGAEGKVLSLGSGWPQAFLEVGASAFVGPLWSVQDESARDAATHFYGELSAGKSLGEALQTMRKKWLDGGSVTFLAYTLYGDPAAKVVRLQEATAG